MKINQLRFYLSFLFFSFLPLFSTIRPFSVPRISFFLLSLVNDITKHDTAMGVTIGTKTLKGDKDSLFLDISIDGVRHKEYLKLYIYRKPRTFIEKNHNKEIKELAGQIRSRKELEINSSEYNSQSQFKKQIDIILYIEKYIEGYKSKDIRKITSMLLHLKSFINDIAGKGIYASYSKNTLQVKKVTEQFCEDFRAYLEEQLTGETPATYFSKFRLILKKATKEGLFSVNPSLDIVNTRKSNAPKDFLTIEEINLLVNTHCGSDEIKRAFLFALNTGLRNIEIRNLKWSEVFDGYIRVMQTKTEIEKNIPLNKNAIKILGEVGEPDDYVFDLPSDNAINKTLGNWAARAKLNKHITFYVARHSFGTNLLFNGNDLKTTSTLLGQTSTKHTERYVRVVNSMKTQAVDSLPEFDF